MIGYWARSNTSDKLMVTKVMNDHMDSKWSNAISIILHNLHMGDAYIMGFGDVAKFMATFKSRLYYYGYKFLEDLITDSSKCDLFQNLLYGS